jgi:hypothetical protein
MANETQYNFTSQDKYNEPPNNSELELLSIPNNSHYANEPTIRPEFTEPTISLEPSFNQDVSNLNQKYNDRISYQGNPDGTTTATIHIKPLFYFDSSGTQQLIDTQILPAESTMGTDSEYQYQSIRNNLKLQFNDQYSPGFDSSLIRVTDASGNHPLTWQPVGLRIEPDQDYSLIDEYRLAPVAIGSNLISSQAIIEENIISFNDIYSGCIDQYLVLPNQLKHEFILKESPIDGFSHSGVDTENLPENVGDVLNYYGWLNLPPEIIPSLGENAQTKSFETSDEITLRDKSTGEAIYQITSPVIYEQASPQHRIPGSYSMIPVGASGTPWSQTMLILSADLAWLNAPERNYPVVLDPDLTTPKYNEGEEGFDTYIVRGNETDPELSEYNYGASMELLVSLAGPSFFSREHHFYRSVLKFPGISSIQSHAQIIEATLILQCKNYGNMSISVFKLFDDWLEGTGTESEPSTEGANWNHSGYNIWTGGNFDGYYTDHATTEINLGPTFYTWDLKDIVEEWVQDPINNPNYGLLLTGTDKEDVIKKFHSSDVANPGIRPIVKIKYNTPPTSTGLTYLELAEDQEITLERTDIFYDPDVDDPGATHEDELQYNLWNGTKWTDLATERSGGLYINNSNFSVKLNIDDQLIITTLKDAQQFGIGSINVRVKDLNSKTWVFEEIIINATATNDPPEFNIIDDEDVSKVTKLILSAQEDVSRDYNIEILDPDNVEFLESNTEKSHGAPGDLEFRWERDKTEWFTIGEEEDGAFIRFNPDNELVGTFTMQITVYDTVWERKKLGNKFKYYKNEVSNDTIELIFIIDPTNDPPNKPKILEPKKGSEFSTDEKITFRGTGFDVDLLNPNSTEKLVYKWILGEGDGTPLGQGQEIKVELSKGTHLITLRVEDRADEYREVNTTISVRNRATIDELNSSFYETDELEDTISFIYQITEEGVEDFKVSRGSLSKIDFFNGDASELSSKRWKQYLFVNLTIKENISSIITEENQNFEFTFYLVKPGHKEEVMDMTGVRYLGSRFDELYVPTTYYAKLQFDNKYYKNNGMGDFKIKDKGKTLSAKAHLGDLEAGEDDYQKLQPDFKIFATVKLEVERHPFGYFEHIITYDSIGYGSEPAPFAKSDSTQTEKSDTGPNAETMLIIGIIIVIIIMCILIGFMVLRSDESKEVTTKPIIYDTTQLDSGPKTDDKGKKKGRKRIGKKERKKRKGEVEAKEKAPGPMMPMPMGGIPHPGPGAGMGIGGVGAPMPQFPGMRPPPPGFMPMPMMPPVTGPRVSSKGPGFKSKGPGRIAPLSPGAPKKSLKRY